MSNPTKNSIPTQPPESEPEWDVCEIQLEVTPPSYGFQVYRFRAVIADTCPPRLAAPIKDVFSPEQAQLVTGVQELRAALGKAGWEDLGLAPDGEWFSYRLKRLRAIT